MIEHKVIPLGIQIDFGQKLVWKLMVPRQLDSYYSNIENWFLVSDGRDQFSIMEDVYQWGLYTYTMILHRDRQSGIIKLVDEQNKPSKQSQEGLRKAVNIFTETISQIYLDHSLNTSLNTEGLFEEEEEIGEWNLL